MHMEELKVANNKNQSKQTSISTKKLLTFLGVEGLILIKRFKKNLKSLSLENIYSGMVAT